MRRYDCTFDVETGAWAVLEDECIIMHEGTEAECRAWARMLNANGPCHDLVGNVKNNVDNGFGRD